jgi:hypothetical protein
MKLIFAAVALITLALPVEAQKRDTLVVVNATLNGTPSPEMSEAMKDQLALLEMGPKLQHVGGKKVKIEFTLRVVDLEPVYQQPGASASIRWEAFDVKTGEMLASGASPNSSSVGVSAGDARNGALQRAVTAMKPGLDKLLSVTP